MKTIRLPRGSRLVRLSVWIAFIGCVSFSAWAAPYQGLTSPWEVAVVFSGAGEGDAFQADVDENVRELSQSKPGTNYRLTLFREFTDREVIYENIPGSNALVLWDSLFFKPPVVGRIEVPGQLTTTPRKSGDPQVMGSVDKLKRFLSVAFKNPTSKKLLIIYAHGLAYNGIKGVKLLQLKNSLEGALQSVGGAPPLDILWFNSCFMANLETIYELRKLARYTMASEEAEFSSGTPFATLDLLSEGPDFPLEVAKRLAEQYLDSYSTLRNGSQRYEVYKSSATISLVDNFKLEGLMQALKYFREKASPIPPDVFKSFQVGLSRVSTKERDLVDLGMLLTKFRDHRLLKGTATSQAASQVLKLIERHRDAELKSNPKIKLEAPQNPSWVIFGYENWKYGSEEDEETLAQLPKELKPMGFATGPFGIPWPYRSVKVRQYIAPFFVGAKEFNFQFLDPVSKKPLSGKMSFSRSLDQAIFQSSHSNNPIVFSGYTQGVGTSGEKYTGLSILDPTRGLPSFDYEDLEFSKMIDWANF